MYTPDGLMKLIKTSSGRRCVWYIEGRNRDCWSRVIQTRINHEGEPSCYLELELRSDRSLGNIQSLIPVVMSGIIAVYGLVVSVLIAGNRASPRFYRSICLCSLTLMSHSQTE